MKKQIRKLWSFHIRNKFTLVDFPVVLVLGTSLENARYHLWLRFEKALYEEIRVMQITNADFCALAAVLYPDLRDYETI